MIFWVLGILAYVVSAVYVCGRLRWYYAREGKSTYDVRAAGPQAAFLPIGASILLMYTFGLRDGDGIPPRSVRRDRKMQEQQDRIRELERQLDL